MNDAKKLSAILYFLNGEWERITPMLKPEELSQLKQELETLKSKLETSQNEDETGEIARDFFPIFSNISPLSFLVEFDSTGLRSGDLSDIEEDIKNKLIKYCLNLRDKIDTKDTVDTL